MRATPRTGAHRQRALTAQRSLAEVDVRVERRAGKPPGGAVAAATAAGHVRTGELGARRIATADRAARALVQAIRRVYRDFAVADVEVEHLVGGVAQELQLVLQ